MRTNAETPDDAGTAIEFGAEGIGLCRTEHMFFETDRLPHIQKMIMADLPIERREALDALLPFQRDDFAGLFRAMDGLPVTIRLLDPPLHEFLPSLQEVLEGEAAGNLDLGTQSPVRLEVFHTPGHSPGHITVYWPAEKVLIAGDLIFYRSTGRVDLPGGDAGDDEHPATAHATALSNNAHPLLV